MTALLIQYKDGSGVVSERLITDIEPHGKYALWAFCHLRQEARVFRLEGIISAIEPETKQRIEDIREFLRKVFRRNATPTACVTEPPSLSGDDLTQLRTKEKQEFYRKFTLPVIADFYKRKLFGLFGNKCFNCGLTAALEIDHHVPIVLGGHLLPGNMVALCKRCNNKKRDIHPREFYSPEQLHRLDQILNSEYEALHFDFDWESWRKDRKGYLLYLGLNAELVNEVLNNPEHCFYVSPEIHRPGTGVTISVDISSLLKEHTEND